MLQNFPLHQTIRKVLAGSGDCAKVDWTFLSLSIPEWTLLVFIGLGLIGLVRNWVRTA
jgi:disulfide bond formation protein DsbB